MNIDPQVRSFYTLKFILQPIVENAIYHGIKERRGPGTVLINASIARDDLLIIIEDNGAGMTIEQLHDMKQALAEAMQRTEKVEDGHKKKRLRHIKCTSKNTINVWREVWAIDR